MNIFTVYVLRSKSTGKIYIGQTVDTKIREACHNDEVPFRKKSYTYKNKGPWEIVYSKEYNTRKEALKRERELKSSRGSDYIKKKLFELVR